MKHNTYCYTLPFVFLYLYHNWWQPANSKLVEQELPPHLHKYVHNKPTVYQSYELVNEAAKQGSAVKTFQYLQNCAQYDIRCLSSLAEHYFMGRPPLPSKDFSTSILLWMLAADHGSADAQYWLALMYSNFFNLPNIPRRYPLSKIPPPYSMIHVKQDGELEFGNFSDVYITDELVKYEVRLKEDEWPDTLTKMESLAVTYLYAAALSGHPGALMSLGNRYENGYGVPKSCPTASQYYLQLAKRVSQKFSSGVPLATELISLELPGVPRPRKAHLLHLILDGADQGDPAMQASIGRGYLLGVHGLEHNYEKALYYLKKAANGNEKGAMALVGYIHALGLGVPKDLDEASKWFNRSFVDEAEPLGANGLGHIYFFGTPSIDRNYSMAFYYFNMSAHLKLPDAQYNLGCLYMAGKGVEKSIHSAINWFSAALVQGHIPSTLSLALIQLNGMVSTASECTLSLILLKRVCSSSPWLSQASKNANDMTTSKTSDEYLLSIWRIAETGDEIAQVHFAYSIEKDSNLFFTSNVSMRRAYASRFLQMAADQNSITALLKLGDFDYYGWGVQQHTKLESTKHRYVDDADEDISDYIKIPSSTYHRNYIQYEEAFGKYMQVSRRMVSDSWRNHYKLRALYNLGFMLMLGLGVKQNFKAARDELERAFKLQPTLSFAPIHLSLWFSYIYELWLSFTWSEFFQLKIFSKLSVILVAAFAISSCFELRRWLKSR